MKVKRLPYNKVCKDRPSYSADRLSDSLLEALNLFQQGTVSKGEPLGDDYCITIEDFKKIIRFMACIWSNNEIYYTTEGDE